MVLITPGSQVRDLPGAFFIVISVGIEIVVDLVDLVVFISVLFNVVDVHY